MSNRRQNQFSSAKICNIRDYIQEDDGDSGISSSSQRNDDEGTDPYSVSGRNVQFSKSPKSPVSPSRPSSSSHSSSSPHSSSPHSPNITSPIYSFPATSGSVTMTRAARIPPRCLAPRERSIAKYPPPFHPDATPNSRINFHVAVKKACASHHSKGVRLSKAIIIGESAVGKTALINRFCRNAFDRDYKATIGVDFEVERFDVLCQPYNLQMWDTAGQERFRCIAASYYRGAHIIVVAFDLTKRHSLASVGNWVDAALKETDPDSALIFIVGAKRDLLSDQEFDALEPEAIRVANRLKAELWITSAKIGLNVTEFFHRVAALGFESLVLAELEAESKSSRNREIGSPMMMIDKKSTIDLRNSDLYMPDSSTKCCKIGK